MEPPSQDTDKIALHRGRPVDEPRQQFLATSKTSAAVFIVSTTGFEADLPLMFAVYGDRSGRLGLGCGGIHLNLRHFS